MRRIKNLTGWLVLVVYWPILFVATHLPRLPEMKVFGRDVTLHIAAYFVLMLIFWLARYGWEKPDFRKRQLYLALLVVAVYAAVDELSQKLVNRHCDIVDWISDMTGALAILVLMMILRRAWHWLIAYGLGMFVVTHWPGESAFVRLPDNLQQFQFAFVMVGYLILTFLWWRSIGRQPRFVFNFNLLLATLFILSGYALLDELVSMFMQRGFALVDLMGAFLGIVIGAGCCWSLARHNQTLQRDKKVTS
ncbi:MAG: VanZ family protein [Sedimentisphaerales bacterium]|nr:VanZ family protein [Sedimentisphaerales bacterium]